MIFALSFAIVALVQPARGWDNHAEVTRYSLQAYENWEPAAYEPLDGVLPALGVKSFDAFIAELAIHGDKVKWDWAPAEPQATVLDVLAHTVVEADAGMDQNLNLSPDQKYMGGYTGVASQAFRHMYYRAWTVRHPLITFHFPPHQMGQAPDRAEIFFELARKAKAAGHLFWAYRFLGFGLHYVEDLGQPYHTSQFAHARLLPVTKLFDWDAFVAEATRIVGNFHLAFEEYANRVLDSEKDVDMLMAFKVPNANEDLKVALEQNVELGIKDGVKKLAGASSLLAGALASTEWAVLGERLTAPGFDMTKGAKIDLTGLDTNPALKEPLRRWREVMFRALSNTGVAVRWYVDRFRSAK